MDYFLGHSNARGINLFEIGWGGNGTWSTGIGGLQDGPNVAKNTEKQSRNIYARCSCALDRRWFSPAGVGGREDPRPLRLHLLRRARSEATQAPNPDRAASVLLREFWILNSIRDPLLVILDPWYIARRTAGEQ